MSHKENFAIALASNVDFYITKEKVETLSVLLAKEVEDRGYGPQEVARVLVHLHTAYMTGARSYSFRHRIVVKNNTNLSSLSSTTLWPEVYNNGMLNQQEPKKAEAYKKQEQKETETVMGILRNGGLLAAGNPASLCYKPGEDGDLVACGNCAPDTTTFINLPGMENKEPVMHCFSPSRLYDLLLKTEAPVNPLSGKPFPAQLVKSLRVRYKADLIIRAHFLESLV